MSREDIIESSINNIIAAIGEDPTRPGLVETPKRVRRMYDEIFEGIRYTNDEIADMFNKCFEEVSTGDLVVVGDIPIFSMCEHHSGISPLMHLYEYVFQVF